MLIERSAPRASKLSETMPLLMVKAPDGAVAAVVAARAAPVGDGGVSAEAAERAYVARLIGSNLASKTAVSGAAMAELSGA